MRKLNFTRIFSSLLVICSSYVTSNAQVTVAGGTTAAGSYTSLSAAATAINATALTGAVTISVTAPYTETAPILLGSTGLNASSSSTNTITINGGGNLITASGVGTSTSVDAVIAIQGTDYVTLQNLNIQENTTATTATTQMEWGIAVVKMSATDGSQNINITNCTIALNKTNTATAGIYGGNHLSSSTTSLTPTAASGTNANIAINGCTISNVYSGISIFGYTSSSTYYDTGLKIGSTTGNTITNYGGGSSTTTYGILVNGQTSPEIKNNTVTLPLGTTTTSYGIAVNSSCNTNLDISGNVVSVSCSATTSQLAAISNAAAFSGTININNNTIQNCTYTTATSAVFYPIYEQAATGTVNINSNTITGINYGSTSTAGSGNCYLIYKSSGSATTVNCNSNTIFNNSFTGTTGNTIAGIYLASGTTQNASNNTIYNNTIPTTGTGTSGTFYGMRLVGTTVVANTNNIYNCGVLKTTGTGSVYGIYDLSSPSNETYNNNIIYGLSIGGAGTVGALYMNTATGTRTVSGNTVYSLSSGGGTVYGLYQYASTPVIFGNKIYDLSSTGASGVVHGIFLGSVTTSPATIYNNLIGDLKSPSTSSTSLAVSGINFTASSGSMNCYYNTVYLNAASTGTNFTTAAVYANTGNTLDLRNNIFINTSTPSGSGNTIAFSRSSTTLSSYASTSNRNLFYAGTPASNKIIFYDGTTAQQTMAAFQTLVSSRDANSFTGESNFSYAGGSTAFFTSTTGSNSNYLKPATGITTQVESGAGPITGITTDYNNVTRPASGTSPDLGAWEFAGITPTPVITLNAITAAQCSAVAHNVSVNITTPSGTITGAVVNYSFNSGTPVAVTMTNTSGSTWTAAIPAATPTNATVTWTVVATSSLGVSGTYVGSSYTDDPLNGSSAVATVSSSSVCSGSADTLTATMIKAGTGSIGTATTTEQGGGVYRNGYGTGDFRHQILYTAAEMTAAGFTAGNITALSFNVSTVGSGSANNYAIKMANVPATVLNGTFQVASFTPVYTATTYTAVAGTNTHTFTTPFYWNGTSNILIDICYNISSIGTSSTLSANAPSVISNTNLLGTTGACTAASGASTYTNRPVISFSGNRAPAATSFSWSDGAAVIGTTNPLIITPTTNKTYTASLTAAGCPITTNGVTVTVIALPTSPVATNSTQCGVGVPTASVSGATTGQTYNWYSAASGGTLLQTGGNTYTTAISTTTTFYVAINNGTCESIRTPVTVTVNAPDAVTATASTTTPCANNALTLTATKAPGSNTYTYSWTANPAAGSGIATPVSGANPSITPTLPGTYVYTVAATSTTCNTTATVTVTVKPSPASITATASQSALCLGGSFNLTSAITGSTTLLSENFNGATNTWTKGNTSGGSGAASLDWTLRADGYSYGSTPVVFHSNDNSQFYQSNADAGGSGTTANTTLQSPVFSTMGYDSVTLKFYHYFKYYSSAASDSATVEVSTNGTTWTPVQTFKGADAGAPAAFASASVNLNSYANQPSLYVRFHYTSGWGYYWNIDNVTVSGGGGTWAWNSTPAGFTAAVQNPANVTPTSAGSYTYTATLTNSVGCSSSATTSAVVVNPTPVVTFTPAIAKICAGSDVSITASGANTYSWSPATGLSATTGATVIASPATTTTYTITGTANGCTGTATKTVTVNPLPVITISPSTTTTICAGSSVTLTASGAATYIWLPPNGLNTTTGSTVIASPTVTTLYNVGGTDSNGCTATATKTINVSLPPVVTVSPTTATSICAGSSVTLTANGAATYKWSPATGLSDTVGATVIASPATTTTYTITGDDGIGCKTTVTKTVTVNTLPPVSISPATTSTICAGSGVTLTASGAATYSWSPATGLSTTTGAITVASPTTTTTYTVTGTGANGCSNTATKTVNVNAAPVLSISPATAGICTGGNITLTASGANTYSWSPATGLNTTTGATVVASPTTTTTYTVTGTGANGCTATLTRQVVVTPIPVVTVSPTTATAICNGASVTLTGNGAATYSWSPATGLSATTGTSVIASPTTTITYTVTGTTNGCSSTATKLVTVNPLPTAAITAAGTTNFCQGGSVTLNANTATGLSYTWRRNGGAIGVTTASYTATTTGSYDVIVSNGTCSATSNAISVIVSTPPTPVILASGPTTVCQGNNVTLSVDPNPAYTYQWQRGGVNIAGANNSTYLASISGDYTIVVTNGTCVVTSQPMTVTVNALPPAIVLPQGPTTFCQGGAVTMFASIAAGYTYQWYINGNIIPGANNATYVATASGDYAVDVADGNCSASAQPVTITVNPLPAQPVIIVTNGTTMTTGQFITYQWYLNGVAIPGATSQTYSAVANGNYTVVVTNFAGCEATSDAKAISSVGVVTYQKEAVTVYPNPASHMIHIAADKVVNVSIRAVDGKEVIRKDNAVDVDIQNLADGIYMIRISDKNGRLIKTERLFKTNK